VTGKGSKERIVYLAGVQKMLVRRYVDERKDDLPALFVGKGSERLTPGGIRRILTKISKQSGVEGVHPHRFRRTLATNLMKAGMPIERVQKILGHVKITTTQLYIYVDDTDVQHDYMRYR
jgi:site-specific recombinase XerD